MRVCLSVFVCLYVAYLDGLVIQGELKYGYNLPSGH